MYNIIGLWIKISLSTDAKHKSRAFKSTYTFNAQDDGAEIFFVIVKNGETWYTRRMLNNQV